MKKTSPGAAGNQSRIAPNLTELLESTACSLQASDGTTCVSDCPWFKAGIADVETIGARTVPKTVRCHCSSQAGGVIGLYRCNAEGKQ